VSSLTVRRPSVTVKSLFIVNRSRPQLVIADSSECAAAERGFEWWRVDVVLCGLWLAVSEGLSGGVWMLCCAAAGWL